MPPRMQKARSARAPDQAAQGQRELGGISARGHQKRSHKGQGYAEHFSPAGAPTHGEADVGQDQKHAQALHDGGRGGAGPVDGLQVRHLREEHGAQGHGKDPEHAARVVRHGTQLGAAVGACRGRGQEEPAGGELANADQPEGLHAVGVHQELGDGAVEAPEGAAQKRADYAAADARTVTSGLLGRASLLPGRQGRPFYLRNINVSVNSCHGPPWFTRAASVAPAG